MNSSTFGFVLVVSAAVSAALIVVLRPLLQRYALARPNARSSHSIPTPQGGGIAVMIATIAGVALATALAPQAFDTKSLALVLAAAAMVALVGAVDDIRTLGVAPRLVLQAIAVAIALAALPTNFQIVPWLPFWVERALLLIGTLWFVNLVNFMDGIDWITVAETIPVGLALVVLGIIGEFPSNGTAIALALAGATLGFAPFNKPVAKLFLGDVGSLPIGLLLAWLLILLAGSGHVAAAILLPFYYACDATLTLALRASRGETLWQAHRSHFYQRALDGGMPVNSIVARIFALNAVLAVLAIATVVIPGRTVSWIALAFGFVAVGLLLRLFASQRAKT